MSAFVRKIGVLRATTVVRHDARGDDERAGREDAAEELAPAQGDVFDGTHARSFAAVLMAARMR